jgi:ABC-type amino acid transport system permease subunit
LKVENSDSAHFQTGVKVSLALYIIGSIIGSIFVIFASVLAGSALAAMEACLLFGVLVIVAWCTIYALVKEKPALLWVFIIVIVCGGYSFVRKRNCLRNSW